MAGFGQEWRWNDRAGAYVNGTVIPVDGGISIRSYEI